MVERRAPFTSMTGPIALSFDSLGESYGPVAVFTDPGATYPELVFSGSQADMDKVRFFPGSGSLGVTLPASTGTTSVFSSASGSTFSVTNLNGRGAELLSVVARIPPGSSVDINLTGSDVKFDGQFAEIRTKSRDGDAELRGDFKNGELSSVAGDFSVQAVSGSLSATSVSGDVHVGVVTGNAQIKTTSGDITVDFADPAERLSMNSVSGDIEYGIGSLGALKKITTRTVSGDVEPFDASHKGGDARARTQGGHERRRTGGMNQ